MSNGDISYKGKNVIFVEGSSDLYFLAEYLEVHQFNEIGGKSKDKKFVIEDIKGKDKLRNSLKKEGKHKLYTYMSGTDDYVGNPIGTNAKQKKAFDLEHQLLDPLHKLPTEIQA